MICSMCLHHVNFHLAPGNRIGRCYHGAAMLDGTKPCNCREFIESHERKPLIVRDKRTEVFL